MLGGGIAYIERSLLDGEQDGSAVPEIFRIESQIEGLCGLGEGRSQRAHGANLQAFAHDVGGLGLPRQYRR